jgi:tetratricopeptide (TPR) repeat protein
MRRAALGLWLASGWLQIGCASTPARTHLEQGQALLLHGQQSRAAREFQQALVTDPEDPAAYLGLGQAHEQAGRTAEAVEAYQRCLGLGGDTADAFARKDGQPTRSGLWIQRAIASRKQARQRMPKMLVAHAQDLEAGQHFEKAVDAYAQASAIAPDNIEALRGEALLRKKLKQPEQALQAWAKLAEAAPQDAQPQKEIGYLLFAQGQMEQSLAAFTKYTRMRPDDAVGFSNLGTACVRAQRYAPAKEAFEKALSIDPYLVQALTGLGSACFYLKDTLCARKAYGRALELDPENAKAKDDIRTMNQSNP